MAKKPPTAAETKPELEESPVSDPANEPTDLAATADEAPEADPTPDTSADAPPDADDTPPKASDEPKSDENDAIPTRKGAKKPYKVWEHGGLSLSGTLYGPGETVLLTDAQAKALGEVAEKA